MVGNEKHIFKMSDAPTKEIQIHHNYHTYPVCNEEEETIMHMIWCQILTNLDWKQDLQTALKLAGIERCVRALLSYGIIAWAKGDNNNSGDHMEA